MSQPLLSSLPLTAPVQPLAIHFPGTLSTLLPTYTGTARLGFLSDTGEVPTCLSRWTAPHLPISPQIHLTGLTSKGSLGVLVASGLALLGTAASGEHRESHKQVRDTLVRSTLAWDSDRGKEGVSLWLFLEIHSPWPLPALEQLHGGAGSWRKSSLTAVGMTPTRREKGVASASTCLWPQTTSSPPSISGPTPKQSVNNAKGVTDFSPYSQNSMILFCPAAWLLLHLT